MQRARSIMVRHPALLAGLLFCVLLTRAIVPSGYMPSVAGGTITLVLCSGTGPVKAIAVSMPGMHHGGETESPAKPEQPCAFAAMAGPMLASADAVLLTAALAFVFLLALLPRALVLPTPPARLRPPLRAPPLPA